MRDVDVLVCGYGPVGAVLTARLAALGCSVLVLEREAQPYPLPRAVAADDEVQRLLHRTADGLLAGAVQDPAVRFADRTGRELGRIRFPRGADGVPGLVFFSQPVLESRLRAHVGNLAGVSVLTGTALTGFAQDRSGVTARLSTGAPVRASWLVGCDGAGSAVRRGADIRWGGRDLADRWLVVDVEGDVPRPDFTYTCDPARPQVDLPTPGGHRWEWLQRGPALDPNALIGSDIDPSTVRVLRAVTYTYGARMAGRWRQGRVLLAGDAAHTMPPFAGQGLGAGLRDAWSLSWRLAAGDPSGYQAERAPQVREATRLSLLLGSVLQARSAASARDLLLASAFRAPALGPWLSRGGPRSTDSGVLASYDTWVSSGTTR